MDKPPTYWPRAVVIYQTRFAYLLQGDLGRLANLQRAGGQDDLVADAGIAAYFGLLTAIITYGICLPLGVLKALKHRTFIDTSSSVLIFLSWSRSPDSALGAILLVHLGARMNLFPLFGLTSPGFDQPGRLGQGEVISRTTRCCR